jgi:hypothetical protein
LGGKLLIAAPLFGEGGNDLSLAAPDIRASG